MLGITRSQKDPQGMNVAPELMHQFGPWICLTAGIVGGCGAGLIWADRDLYLQRAIAVQRPNPDEREATEIRVRRIIRKYIVARLALSTSLVLADFRGITVKSDTGLRREFRGNGCHGADIVKGLPRDGIPDPSFAIGAVLEEDIA